MKRLLGLSAALPLLLPAAALAGQPADAAAGQQIVLHGNQNGAMPCAACHGRDGAGNASIGAPALAGRAPGEIVADLKTYAAGEGGNATMQYIANALSPQEMQDVAAYFAALPKK